MRERQQVIFAGPFGCTILQDGYVPRPAKVINPEVAAWRLGKAAANPQSKHDEDDLTYRFQNSAILNETHNNEYRADHPPGPIEQRRERRIQFTPVNSNVPRPYVTPIIHRRVRREHVASPGVLEFDTVRVSESDLAYLRAIECRLRATNTARANAICAALRLARIAEAEQY